MPLHTGFTLHGLLDGGQPILERGIVGIVLQSLLVGIICAQQVALSVQSGAFAAPALCPVGLDLSRLFGVGEGMVIVLLGGISG